MVMMNKQEKILKKIRQWETELISAKPSRAAKLTGKIVKWKGQVFDK